MYDPKGNGKDKAVDAVRFDEIEPPEHLRGIVHRYLELQTNGTLPQDYRFHALPDACTYIVFDQINRTIMGVSKLRAQAQEFNLGKRFHFLNIRLLPGVWRAEDEPIADSMLDTAYEGTLPFADTNQRLNSLSLSQAEPILSALVEHLIENKIVARNPTTELIFQNLDDIGSVADMAEAAGISPRQLQRTLKRTTGFAPHDFLKVLRLQQSLNGQDTWNYADQSHFIHSFRAATGYTPGKHTKKFDV